MMTGNNDIGNDIGNSKNNNNINDNDQKKRRYEQGKKVDFIVEEIVRKFKSAGVIIEEKSKPFLYKAAWRLSEARIWSNFESALKGDNKIGLFIYLCKRDGV